MPPERAYPCSHCGFLRPESELLRVSWAGSPERRPYFICRPLLQQSSVPIGECFRAGVGPTFMHRIELAAASSEARAIP
jgi:hypothetical protein